jgi:two-component system OmpR family response regulator
MKPSSKIKIFLVDDDLMFVKSLKHLLSEERREIKTFSCGEECLKSINEQPSIIVLDYSLNNSLNGVQVLNRIKHSSPETKVIMLSGIVKPGIISDTIKYGAYDYIAKGENWLLDVQKDITTICDEIESTEQSDKDKRQVWWINGGIILVILLMYIINRLKF